MEVVQWREYLEAHETVEVDCTHPCVVRLFSDVDLKSYKVGEPHCCYGGFLARRRLIEAVECEGRAC